MGRSNLIPLAQLAREVRAAPPRLGRVRLICLDGPAGSGKSTLAHRLALHLDNAPIVRMDDLYEGWHGLGKVWDRLEEWVLAPLRAGRPGRYRRYDWEREEYAEWHSVPCAPALIVEGVGAADRPVDVDVTLRIWVEAPLELRYERGMARDGEAFRPYWQMWAAQENDHFTRHRTRERADLIVDTGADQAYDREVEVRATRMRP